MAVSKLSQIASAPGAPALTDTIVGVGGGTTDYQYTYGQIASTIGLTNVTGKTFYVRTAPVAGTISNVNPGVVTATAHGLQVNDPVAFSIIRTWVPATSISAASPGVVTKTAHGLAIGDPVAFINNGDGTLNAGITPNQTYYVIAAGFTANQFEFSATVGGAAINTGAGTGTQNFYRTGALPPNVTEGAVYYVITAGLTANAFEFSATVGGSAVDCTGTQTGYFVWQTGNDANNGLAQTRTGAFMTVQAAANYLSTKAYTTGIAQVLLSDGTYYESVVFGSTLYGEDSNADGIYQFLGGSGIIENVIIRGINTGGLTPWAIAGNAAGQWFVGFLTLEGTDSGGTNLVTNFGNSSQLYCSTVNFGAGGLSPVLSGSTFNNGGAVYVAGSCKVTNAVQTVGFFADKFGYLEISHGNLKFCVNPQWPYFLRAERDSQAVVHQDFSFTNALVYSGNKLTVDTLASVLIKGLRMADLPGVAIGPIQAGSVSDADGTHPPLQQIPLTGDTSYFVRTPPVVVSVSNANPAVVTCAGGHGFQIGDPVVFSTPLDRGICTISVGSPGLVTYPNHGFAAGDPVSFDWSGGQLGIVGALPTGLTAAAAPPSVSPLYYVTNNGALTTNTFNVSDTQAHALAGTNTVNTTAPTGSIAITSGTYVSGTGVITLALPSLNFSVGDPVILTNLTGTGAFASLVGTWTVLTVTGTTAATLQGPAGAGAAAITGGTAMIGTNYVQRWSTMPSPLDSNTTYYVMAAGFSSTTFEFTTVFIGGSAGVTTTNQIGKVTCQTGNDLNNGSAATRTGAFLTVQAAILALNRVNIGTNQVTLQLADGTYAIPSGKAPIDFSKLSPLPPSTLGRPAFIKIRGNGNNQDQVVIRASGGNIGCFLETAGPAPGYFLRMDFIRLYHTDNGESCVKVADKTPETNNYIQLFGITFVNGFEKLVAVGQCLIDYLQSNFYFVGNAGDSIIHLSDGAQARLNYGTTFTAIGTVNSPNAFLVMGDGQFPRASGLINGGAFFFGNYTGLVWNIGNEARINEYLSSLVSGGTSSTATGIQGIASLTQPGTMFGGGVNTYYSSVDLVPYRGLNFISGAVADFLYNRQTPSTGFSLTLDNNQGQVILDPAGTLASGTIIMPPSPKDGQMITIRSSQTVTALTVTPNSGQTVVAAPGTLSAGTEVTAIYDLNNGKWYFTYVPPGGGSAVMMDTLKNILLATPTSGKQAYATDYGIALIGDGSVWQVDSSWYAPETSFNIGMFTYSNPLGYGKNYLSDLLLANCTIGQGSNPGTNNGDLRNNQAVGQWGQLERYSVGAAAWRPIVEGLVLTENVDPSHAIQQTPIGFTEPIIVFNGDSAQLGLNGVPLIEGYIASMGAYPPLQTVSGGTF